MEILNGRHCGSPGIDWPLTVASGENICPFLGEGNFVEHCPLLPAVGGGSHCQFRVILGDGDQGDKQGYSGAGFH